ncbi:uncharacterized protein LOC141608152 [Silene latifolia]|uniref:uncharacterized protein LOC141608152 n=1 Tax=Silene latifolia TaxID=37657 RepID=UPI003D788C54
MINGDGAEEYGRVWEYANALRTYNPGSTVIVVVDNVENPPPIFQRMYVCFKACRVGFLAGCRPVIRVDGCHLKGSYPGMILVAVSMDANNNIYHVVWAVVEVENSQSWTWFLTLLMEDLEKVDGEGLTITSDRQKGLLEALNRVTPKAEIRFCVDHRGKKKAVNLALKTCSCKSWQLTGIPCPHATFCIREQRDEVLDYVDEFYTKETYLKAFQHPIAAMPGYGDWEKVDLTPPAPPPYKKLPGRPKLKKRRRESGDGSSGQTKRL